MTAGIDLDQPESPDVPEPAPDPAPKPEHASNETQEHHEKPDERDHDVDKAREMAFGNRIARRNLEITSAEIAEARDAIENAYAKDGTSKTPDTQVPTPKDIQRLERERDMDQAKVDRAEEAYGLVHDAVRNPAKLDELYVMGRSKDAKERAIAHIALSGLKAEKRAYRAEQMGERGQTAAKLARLRKDLKMQNTSEMMHQKLLFGQKVPETKKPRPWQVWKR
jgi:hypothetical protein